MEYSFYKHIYPLILPFVSLTVRSLSHSVPFLFLDITRSEYWKHKDTKVGQDEGRYPEMFSDAKQCAVITPAHSISPPPRDGYLSKLSSA